MNPFILVVIGLLYLFTGCQFVYNRQPYMAMVWFGYSFAQIGFVLQTTVK